MTGRHHTTPGNHPAGIARRGFLTLAGGALLSLASASVEASLGSREARTLALANLHTGETLRATYWERGRYLPDALDEINRILRDHRTNEILAMDTRLLDLLHDLRSRLDSKAGFEVISGYRSPRTNARLRRAGHGVAMRSLHVYGMAIDVRLPGRELRALRQAAVGLHRGGVGYYPGPGFVHVDVGRVRYW